MTRKMRKLPTDEMLQIGAVYRNSRGDTRRCLGMAEVFGATLVYFTILDGRESRKRCYRGKPPEVLVQAKKFGIAPEYVASMAALSWRTWLAKGEKSKGAWSIVLEESALEPEPEPKFVPRVQAMIRVKPASSQLCTGHWSRPATFTIEVTTTNFYAPGQSSTVVRDQLLPLCNECIMALGEALNAPS